VAATTHSLAYVRVLVTWGAHSARAATTHSLVGAPDYATRLANTTFLLESVQAPRAPLVVPTTSLEHLPDFVPQQVITTTSLVALLGNATQQAATTSSLVTILVASTRLAASTHSLD
jgi:hypothetical protein